MSALPRFFAGKVALACRPTCSCATWTWQFATLLTAAGWKMVADGLTLWRGTQLAIETTMVSPSRRDRTTRPRAANFDGAALEVARRRKEATYPEISGEGGRARREVDRGALGPARPGRDSLGETVERHIGVYCHPCFFFHDKLLKTINP